MNAPQGPIALFAGFLAVLALLSLPFGPDISTPLLLGGAALFTLALALLARAAGVPRVPPRSSLPAVGCAVGITLIVGGAEVGTWMLAMGIGVLVLSAGVLVAERRAG